MVKEGHNKDLGEEAEPEAHLRPEPTMAVKIATGVQATFLPAAVSTTKSGQGRPGTALNHCHARG